MKDSSDSSPGGRRQSPRKRIGSTNPANDKRDRRPSAAGSYTGSGRPPFWNKPNDPEKARRAEGNRSESGHEGEKPAGKATWKPTGEKRFGDRKPGFKTEKSGWEPDKKPRSFEREKREGARNHGNSDGNPNRRSASGMGASFGKGEDKPRRFGSDRVPTKPAGNTDRPRRFGKDAGVEKSGYDRERKPFAEKGRKEYGNDGDRKPFAPRGQKPFGDREKKPFGARKDGDAGNKKRFETDRGADNGDRKREREGASFPKSSRLGKQAPAQVRTFRRAEDRPAEGEAPTYNQKRIERAAPGTRTRQRAGSQKDASAEKNEGSLMRLNRFIAHSGLCSRREADELIATGQITVNGKMVDQMGYLVKMDDVVKYGKRLLNKEKLVYVLLNKPKDFITTTEDPEERKTVMSLVATACKERIYPVGRLDRQTTGLLLLTNDGELSEKLMHPSHNIKKIYQVDLDKPLTANHEKQIREGVELEDGLAPVDELEVLSKEKDIVGISIHLGRNRIVRRIFESLGYEVVKLDRVMYAGLTKKDLPRGNWRFLTEKEVINLKYFS